MQWEYCAVKCRAKGGSFLLDEGELEREMNRLGRQGWELITALYATGPVTVQGEAVLLFKRPRVATVLPAEG